jgi:phosphate acyltransferase
VTRVAVDAMGGDRAPEEVIAGALEAAAGGIEVTLFGPEGLDTGGLELVVSPSVIDMAEKPAEAVRAKPDSSLVRAVRAVADGRADAVVSAGNTGAMLAAGLLQLRRLPGVARPAIAVPIPARDGPSLLIDGGANAEARAEHLFQFGVMGSVFAAEILGIADPSVRLLSNGGEPEKGDPLRIEAHALLAAAPDLNFAGNIEAGALLGGAADVVVSDGFTGNIALKLMEGVSQTMLGAVRDAAMSSGRAKLGGVLLRGALSGFREEIDPEASGGAYLLGLRRLGVVPHGRFTRTGFAQAILRAERGAREDIVAQTHTALEHAGALKRPPVSASGASLRGTG